MLAVAIAAAVVVGAAALSAARSTPTRSDRCTPALILDYPR